MSCDTRIDSLTTPPPQLHRLRPAPGARVRLLCLPWCGAGAGAYRHLARLLPATVDVLAVQLPGRQERFGEPPLRRMAQVVEHIVEGLQACTALPLALFGHSMGATVAHEVAQAWRARTGREPALLVASGAPPPAAAGGHWHAASDAQFLAYLHGLGGTPVDVLHDAGLMRVLLPALRADYEVLETWGGAQHPPLNCPLIACAGRDDTSAPASSLAGWQRLSTTPCGSHLFEGGHFYLVDRTEELAARLLEWMPAA